MVVALLGWIGRGDKESKINHTVRSVVGELKRSVGDDLTILYYSRGYVVCDSIINTCEDYGVVCKSAMEFYDIPNLDLQGYAPLARRVAATAVDKADMVYALGQASIIRFDIDINNEKVTLFEF